MTPEQKEARKRSAESGNIRWIKDHCLRDKDENEDFLFISYKSDDFQQVLEDIVYKLCKEYGLKVYFDASFDDNSESWVTQFYENIQSQRCKGMLMFLSDAYHASYATLMELMASQTKMAGGNPYKDLFVLPVTLSPFTHVYSEENTGLGTMRYKDGTTNGLWKKELDLFNILYRAMIKKEMVDGDDGIYNRSGERNPKPYLEETDRDKAEGKLFLNKTMCCAVMDEILEKLDVNGLDGGNKEYVKAIHDKLISAGISTVFGQKDACGSQDTCGSRQVHDKAFDNRQQAAKYPHITGGPGSGAEYFRDSIGDFEQDFTKLTAEYKKFWQDSGNTGKTPPIRMEIYLTFHDGFPKSHTIKGRKWKRIFTEMMEYFYQMSGEAYYSYAGNLCSRAGIAEPAIIDAGTYRDKIKDKERYTRVGQGQYYFFNSYSAKNLIKAVVKHIAMYCGYLKSVKGNKGADLSNVSVEYKIHDPEAQKLMTDIKGARDSLSASEGEETAFEPEAFSGFIYRFKQISARHKEDWKSRCPGNTPPIPFSRISLHMPEGITEKAKVTADNWKPLFRGMMDEFCRFTGGDYCEWRSCDEEKKGIKMPLVVSGRDFSDRDICHKRYEPIENGKYYFYNNYGVPELLAAMWSELERYVDFVNGARGTRAEARQVKISFSLPKGEYADMFS